MRRPISIWRAFGFAAPRRFNPSPKKTSRIISDACNRPRPRLHQYGGLVIGVGGEHGVTPPLARAAAATEDLRELTVVHFDAHADLRDSYDGTPHSHACAMRRLLDRGASVVTIGCRSAEREEYAHGLASGRVRTFMARTLAQDPGEEQRLFEYLDAISGRVYLTIDVDVLEVHLCSGTGTPEPGGAGMVADAADARPPDSTEPAV